jgi:Zn-dependent M28 family amino/carboxypeptidase
MIHSCIVLALTLAAPLVAANPPSPAASPAAKPAARKLSPSARAWWSHVQTLAADSMRGRETGGAGYRKSADYVAREFARWGAKPGGRAGYFQPVHFVSRRVDESRSSLELVRGARRVPLVLGRDATLGMGIDPAPSLEAPLVFAGYGISIPEEGYDDLKFLDLKGKIAVCIQGGPSSLPGPLRAHAQSTKERWARLRAAGAIGLVIIPNPKHMDVPWERARLARLLPSMTLADSRLDQTPGQKFSARINPASAEKLFDGSGHTFQQMLAVADRGKQLPRFKLAWSLRARVGHTRTTVESPNVIGILPGSDPQLRHEFVVLSAHLDHLGVGAPIRGDSIYNGAMDNASGIASLIEIARLAHESGRQPRRSIVLLAVTGEEKGLQGSRFFAAYPTVPGPDIVANLNLDMFLPLVPVRALTVYGLEESDLGDWATTVAARHKVKVLPDAEPQRNIFIRSDQYNFIRNGVPALAFKIAPTGGAAEVQLYRDWIRERYHAPSDDLAQPVDADAGARFTRLLYDLCADAANRDQRPSWKPSSFFRRYAADGGR